MDWDRIFLYVLVMVMGIFLFVLMQSYMISLDTSAWTFRGHVEAALILGITPTLFLITLILVPVYFMVKEAD